MPGVKDPERNYTRTEEQLAQEVEMMRTPERWPCWPLLPIKRMIQDHNFPEIGCLIDIMFAKDLQVYVGMSPYVQVRLQDATSVWPDVVRYASYEDIVADGWVVD